MYSANQLSKAEKERQLQESFKDPANLQNTRSRDDRTIMVQAMMDKVFARLKEQKPELEIKDAMYCSEPLIQTMNDYMDIVDKTIEESESLSRMIDSKDLDIA